MFDPTEYPYARVLTYSDGIAPVVTSDEFYNPTQDHLGRLFGAQGGISTTMHTDDFTREGAGIVAGGQVGTDFTMYTGTNAVAATSSGIADGDHGIWYLRNNVGGVAHDILLRDGDNFVGARQFIWTARVRFLGRAAFETRANEGVVVGMWALGGGTNPAFRAGSNFANWYAYYNDGADQFIDTGVQMIDDTWYTLIITRKVLDNKLRWYIGTGISAPTLKAVSPAAYNSAITSCRRFVRNVGTAASAALDGFFIDKYSAGIER